MPQLFFRPHNKIDLVESGGVPILKSWFRLLSNSIKDRSLLLKIEPFLIINLPLAVFVLVVYFLWNAAK